jgi:hypothetical protein
MHQFTHGMAAAVEAALKVLLSEKHLYQTLEVNLGFMDAAAKQVEQERRGVPTTYQGMQRVSPPNKAEEILANAKLTVAQAWTPYIRVAEGKPDMVTTVGNAGSPIQFALPTINTFCDQCGTAWPFNAVSKGALCLIRDAQSAWFYLGYECQQCKGFGVRFLVRRQGFKLRLVGRDPIEVLPTPVVLPRIVSKYYSDAQIAHHAGQTLAGLFLLRTFVEQYWRTLQPVKDLISAIPRATGDEQGDAYQKTLPDDFKARFPSLKDIYSQLSAAMHEANADGDLFRDSSARVVKHFEARKLFDLL